ncbi:MAG: sulfate ABC transporter substrate-binding protein [Candidatus Methylacidiphilales bacterium]|nr:sulfate ABC transporter substrate-binding protein [Candidatus Methylacidiphilales bacterium]
MLTRNRILPRNLADMFTFAPARSAVAAAAVLAWIMLGINAFAPGAARAADPAGDAPTLAQEAASSAKLRILTYSYGWDFFNDYAEMFKRNAAAKGGPAPVIKIEPGQSTRLIEGVVKGDAADVVAMTSPGDLTPLVKAGLLAADWQTTHKAASIPFQTTIVFLVRKGNPRGVKDWGDLVREGVSVIVASPLNAGSGRYSYLAAWSFQKAAGKTDAEAREFVKKLFTVNASVTGGGRKGSTSVFVDNKSLDVLLTFETEIMRLAKEYPDKFDIVRPPTSVLCEFPAARLTKYTQLHGNDALAQAFVDQLYTPEAQRLGCKHGLRSIHPDIRKEFSETLPPMKMTDVTKEFGPWADIMQKHFVPGGEYDKMNETD